MPSNSEPVPPYPIAVDPEKPDEPCATDESQGSAPQPVGVIRLLQYVRVPPGYKKIVRARMDGRARAWDGHVYPLRRQPSTSGRQCTESGRRELIVGWSLFKQGAILGEVAQVEEVVLDPGHKAGDSGGEVPVGVREHTAVVCAG